MKTQGRDKRHYGTNLIHMPITVERCSGLLRHHPTARGWIQVCVDWTRLHVVNRDTPAPDPPWTVPE